MKNRRGSNARCNMYKNLFYRLNSSPVAILLVSGGRLSDADPDVSPQAGPLVRHGSEVSVHSLDEPLAVEVRVDHRGQDAATRLLQVHLDALVERERPHKICAGEEKGRSAVCIQNKEMCSTDEKLP